MITNVISLLMNYFPDDRPVSTRTFREWRCDEQIVKEAFSLGYIEKCGNDEDGYTLLRITNEGKKHR